VYNQSQDDESSSEASGSDFDGSAVSDDDEEMSGDESGEDWEELEEKAAKCMSRFFLGWIHR
jgi:hypothetical protein